MRSCILFYTIRTTNITERAGFEPAVLNKEHTGFRNRLLQPLGHLSINSRWSFDTFLDDVISERL